MGEDRTGAPRQTERRVTVSEAAQVLGITPEAVRMRIKRGTLRSERQAGRVYVLLGLEPNTEHTTDRTTDHTEELIRTLREQLELERQAHAEARRIIAGLVERIPAIEAPSEPPGGADSVVEEPERGQPRSGTPGPQESAERPPDTAEWPVRGGSLTRPWWRRMFGG